MRHSNHGAKSVFLLLMIILSIGLSTQFAVATGNGLIINITEYVFQTRSYNPDTGEQATGSSSTGYALQNLSINGTINVTNIAQETLSDINVTIANTDEIQNQFEILSQPSYSDVNLSDFTAGNDVYLFIRELQPNDTVILNYTVSPEEYKQPVDLNLTYSKTKVLTNSTVNVTMWVRNGMNRSGQEITVNDLTLTMTPQAYTDSAGNNTYFNYSAGEEEGSGAPLIGYIYAGNPTHGKTTDWIAIQAHIHNSSDALGKNYTYLEWNISNRSLTQSNFTNLTFLARAPLDINDSFNDSNWGQYIVIGNITLDFTLAESYSNLSIGAVYSSGPARLAALKQRVDEDDWRIGYNFSNRATLLDYNLSTVTIFATNYSFSDDPGNLSTRVDGSFYWFNYTTAGTANVSNLSTKQDFSTVQFTYANVPVVWADATHVVFDDGTQINRVEETQDLDNQYYHISEIFVLAGYIVKATKTIEASNKFDNVYNVTIVIENIGNDRTPDRIAMFDLLPPKFWPIRNVSNRTTLNENPKFTNRSDKNMSLNDTFLITNETLTYRGVNNTGNISNAASAYDEYFGYNIELFPLNSGSGGDGAFTEADYDKEVELFYMMNGTGQLAQVRNAYIVGIDPQRIEGAHSSRTVGSAMGGASKSLESVVFVFTVVASAALVVISRKFRG